MAEPLGGGELVDPHGGRARPASAGWCGWSRARALAEDPLRALRAVRIAVELELELDPATGAAAAAHARGIARRRAGARVRASSSAWSARRDVRRGLELMDALGLTDVVLPELAALRGVEQSDFHHVDVYDHTLEVLEQVARLAARAGAPLGDGDAVARAAGRAAGRRADPRRARCASPRCCTTPPSPQTRAVRPDGRVTFIGHDARGRRSSPATCCGACAPRSGCATTSPRSTPPPPRRSASSSTSAPLDRRDGLALPARHRARTAPTSTLFTVADRLATRGRNAGRGDRRPPRAGRASCSPPRSRRRGRPRAAGPRRRARARGRRRRRARSSARCSRSSRRTAYAGAIATREDALARARELLRRAG